MTHRSKFASISQITRLIKQNDVDSAAKFLSNSSSATLAQLTGMKINSSLAVSSNYDDFAPLAHVIAMCGSFEMLELFVDTLGPEILVDDLVWFFFLFLVFFLFFWVFFSKYFH